MKETLMKKLFLLALALTAFLWNVTPACAGDARDREGITRALNLYTEAAVKGDSKIAQPAFAPRATMSYTEKGKLVTVPISELFAYYDKTGPHQATYKIETVKVAGDVAVVSIDSRFGDTSFDDMFTLVKDGDDWKIVSKVYHIR